MSFKIKSKEMYPILVFRKRCWSVNSKVVRLGKHAHSKKRSHSRTTSAITSQVYVHARLVQHLQCIFSTCVDQNKVWYIPPTSETV